MRVYLDNNATTRPGEAVVAAVAEAMRRWPGNPSSIHSFGQEARRELDKARFEVADLVGTRPEDVLFTSGGTESNNHVLNGIVELYPGSCHIITTIIEHASVYNTCQHLASQGVLVTMLPVDDAGRIDPADVERSLRPDTRLVSIMLANNDLGTIQPVEAVGRVMRQRGILMHCDAVQAVGKMAVDFRLLGVDLLSLSAHKFNGPRGVGALVRRSGTKLPPFLRGGRQERGMRAGTENLPAIVGMGVAAKEAQGHLAERRAQVRGLRDRLEERVLATVAGSRRNGPVDGRLPNTSNLSFSGTNGQLLAIHLDMMGVAVSTGSACSSQSDEPSRILLALGRTAEEARESIRISLSHETTAEEVDYAADCIAEAVAELRAFQNGQRGKGR